MKFSRSHANNEEVENICLKGFVRKLARMDSDSSHSSSRTSSQELLSSLGGDENDSEGYSAVGNYNIASASRHLEQEIKLSSSNSMPNSQKSTSSVTSEYIELPKKRWLREAVQDQQRWDSSQELARPINWDETNLVEYANQRRPTVLMRVQDHGATKEVSRADMQTAIALVELKNGGPINYRQY